MGGLIPLYKCNPPRHRGGESHPNELTTPIHCIVRLFKHVGFFFPPRTLGLCFKHTKAQSDQVESNCPLWKGRLSLQEVLACGSTVAILLPWDFSLTALTGTCDITLPVPAGPIPWQAIMKRLSNRATGCQKPPAGLPQPCSRQGPAASLGGAVHAEQRATQLLCGHIHLELSS